MFSTIGSVLVMELPFGFSINILKVDFIMSFLLFYTESTNVIKVQDGQIGLSTLLFNCYITVCFMLIGSLLGFSFMERFPATPFLIYHIYMKSFSAEPGV